MTYLVLTCLTLIILIVYYMYSKYDYSFFERRGIEYFAPSFPFGNLRCVCLGHKNVIINIRDCHLKIKSTCAGFFIFSQPILMVRDRDLIEKILDTDFDHFTDRGTYRNMNEPMSCNIFSMPGEKWHNMRQKVCPLYKMCKLKMIFPAIYEIGMSLQGYIGLLADTDTENKVDIMDICERYFTDVIASIAFGIEVDSIRDPSVYFRKMGEKIANQSVSKRMLIYFFYFNSTWLYKVLGLRVFDVEIEEFLIETVKQTINFREKNKFRRDDFMQLLIDMRNQTINKSDQSLTEDTNGLSIIECASNVLVFFSIGFFPASTIMSFCLLELARNPNILEKVQLEVDCILNRHDFKFTYECMRDMKYLQQCIDETIRMYSPTAVIPRICTKDYTVPEKGFSVTKGMKVVISAQGVHYDPKIYPNPEIFDPSRFTEEEKSKRHPADFLGFGLGPRNCNAKELSYLTLSMGLSAIISSFNFEIIHPKSQDVPLDVTKFTMLPEGGIHMKFKRRIFEN